MYAEWQPQRGRNTGQADDQCVSIHTLVDNLLAIVRIEVCIVLHDDAGDVANRRGRVREAVLELFVTVEQFREPDHKGVVAEEFRILI